ncbi:MAG TPA: DUF4280 domain-containing protein, partial [Ilumatobacteraceae bacterium]|nr:DUF4280 domain-containing protein [Ilumatobacteraceae bacterium]
MTPAVMGSMMMCTFGVAPSTLVVLPTNQVMGSKLPMANINDAKPIVNIPPFGMCTSLSNPTVAAATASAAGVLTPMPCIPVTTVWMPGKPTTMVAKMPAVDITCKAMCNWGGSISFVNS